MRPADDLYQGPTIFAVADEVDVRGVDDEQRRIGVAEEEGGVGLGHLAHVLRADGTLRRTGPPVDALEQHLGARLQVDHQVGDGRAGREGAVEADVEGQLVGEAGLPGRASFSPDLSRPSAQRAKARHSSLMRTRWTTPATSTSTSIATLVDSCTVEGTSSRQGSNIPGRARKLASTRGAGRLS